MSHSVFFVMSWCLATSILFGQQTWKVSCNGGPGVHFTDLPPAVAAASPGDQILVYYGPGTCAGGTYFNAPVIDKPLRISGFFVSSSGTGTTRVTMRGNLLIQNIPSGHRVEVCGLAFGELLPAQSIVVADCQGDILLDNVVLFSYGGPNTFARIERSNSVVLRNCDLVMGGSPLVILDSTVLLTTSAIDYQTPYPTIPYAMTTETIRVTNSTVTAVDSVVWGAMYYFLGGAYTNRPAVVIDSGIFRIGPAATLVGGINTSFPPSWHASAYQIINPALGAVHRDPRSTVIPTPSPAAVPVTINATYHDWVVANEPYRVAVAGPPGGFAVLAFGDWLPNVPTPFGPFSIDPLSVFAVDIQPLSATTGSHEWNFFCPLTAPVNHAFAFQAVTISPTGALGLTIASPLTVNWPHGVTP